MMTSPQVSWLFFKAQPARSASRSDAGGATSIRRGGCALLLPVRLGPPCRRPILNATTSPLIVRRHTRSCPKTPTLWILESAVSLPTTEDYRVEKHIVNRNHREWSQSPGRDRRIAPALPRHKH